MAGPMQGLRVIEYGVWVAGPAAAGILCDWGADVTKIEPLEGDPLRGMMAMFRAADKLESVNGPFELDNRGKRSVALNLRTPEAREIAYRLVADADVFITNVRPGGLERTGMDYATLRGRNGRLIYAQVTGYGPDGEDRDRPGFDIGAFWSRAGVAALLTPEGHDFPLQRGGMGDHFAAVGLVAGIGAALYRRAQTGEGERLSVSLARTGAYFVGFDLNITLATGRAPSVRSREHFTNPLGGSYRTADGKGLWLLMLQADRHWPDFCRALGRPDWEHDERFASMGARAKNATVLVREIDAVLATKPLGEWAEVLDGSNVWWAPVQTADEVVRDPVMRAAGAFVDVPLAEQGTREMVATPVDFLTSGWRAGGPAPELGQDTEAVLLGLGYDWEAIAHLKEVGAIL